MKRLGASSALTSVPFPSRKYTKKTNEYEDDKLTELTTTII